MNTSTATIELTATIVAIAESIANKFNTAADIIGRKLETGTYDKLDGMNPNDVAFLVSMSLDCSAPDAADMIQRKIGNGDYNAIKFNSNVERVY